jgi:regulator of RNase E activity RraA
MQSDRNRCSRTAWRGLYSELMVGFAKTATIRARDPVSGSSYLRKRLDYLDYVAAAPRPSIVVIEDKDEPPGYGAFWGEVQTNVHKALDCLGTVTNGSIRGLAAVAEGFQMLAGSIAPSHAYVHVVEFDISVTVHGMEAERRSYPRRDDDRDKVAWGKSVVVRVLLRL